MHVRARTHTRAYTHSRAHTLEQSWHQPSFGLAKKETASPGVRVMSRMIWTVVLLMYTQFRVARSSSSYTALSALYAATGGTSGRWFV